MTSRVDAALLEAEELSVTFVSGGRPLHAVDRVDLATYAGEAVAVVGESGSGKTTLAMAMMRARRPTSGRIRFHGTDITDLPEKSLSGFRREVQMVFQDPYSSLDPTMSIADILGEPLRAHGERSRASRRERASALLQDVGLDVSALDRRPGQFSGGQRQRIAIARALALGPSVLVADEPVSALDVSVQAQIVNLLRDLQAERDIALLLISHDLPLVHHLADRVVVMYLGRVVEESPSDDLLTSPQHPYTAALLSAAPALGRTDRTERIVLSGSPPSAMSRPPGCAFHPRCPIARPRCATDSPPLAPIGAGRRVACHYPGELPGPLTGHRDLSLTPREVAP